MTADDAGDCPHHRYCWTALDIVMRHVTGATVIIAICCLGIMSAQSVAAEDLAIATLAQADSGPVPMTIGAAQLLTANVKINGVETSAIVDTGSSDLLVDNMFAAQHALAISRSAASSAVGGTIRTGIIPDVRVEIGRLNLASVRAHTSDLDGINSSKGTSFAAILGMSVMSAGDLELDFQHMQLRIGNKQPVGTSGTVATRSYPLALSNGIPVLTVPLNGRTIKVAFDTGKDTDIDVSDAVFDLLKPADGRETSIAKGGLGGISIARLSTAPALSFAGYSLKDVSIEGEKPGGLIDRLGVDAIVGLRIIRRFNVTFDFVRHQAFLTPSHVAPPPAKKSTSGLQLAYGNAFARVVHVMANSPAAAAGWHTGDQICRINGNDIHDVTISPQLKAWGTDTPGKTVTFAVCGGEGRTLVLKAFY